MKRTLTIVIMFLPFLFGGLFFGHAMDEGDTSSSKAWLGVSTSDMTARLAKSMHVKTTEGALVKDVMEDSPAEKAGLKEDDIIVEFNGAKISDSDDLLDAVRKSKPGTSAAVVVSRDDQRKTFQATLGKTSDWSTWHSFPDIPPVPDIHVAVPRFTMSTAVNSYGLWIRDLNKQLGNYFGAPGGRGVLVEEVEEGSPADSAGFKAGDVIIKVQNDDVAHTRDIWDALEDMKNGETASVDVIRKGNSQKLSLRVEEPRHHGMRFHEHSFRMPDFDTREFKHEMEQFGREMREMGKEIQSQTRDLRYRLREELQHPTI